MDLKAKYQVKIDPIRKYQEVYVNYFANGKEYQQIVYVNSNPKYKEKNYIKEAKKHFKPNYKTPVHSKTSFRFPVVPVSIALVAAIALGTGGFFLYRYLNNGGSTGDWAKADLAMEAAVEKVDKFNETLASITNDETAPEDKADALSSSGSNETIIAYYQDNSQYSMEYARTQMFGFYIFYNIYYGAKYMIPDNNVSLTTPLYGYTNRMPDATLQKYWDSLGCNNSLLSVKYNLEDDGLSFAADWNFKIGTSQAFKENLAIYNSVILTTGKIKYDFANNKVKGFNLNYFWSDDNRNFASYDLDFEKNKFYSVTASGTVDETTRTWRESDKISKIWNSGEINHNKLKDYSYRYYYAYTGNIATDAKDLNMHSYLRYINKTPKAGDVIDEPESENKTKFDALFDETSKICSAVPVRDLDEAIDITSGKEVTIDNCVKYGEAVSSVYWMHEKKISEYDPNYITYEYSGVSLVPFIEKDDLTNLVTLLLQEDVSSEQKAVLNKAKDYLNSLKEKDYFGTFETNDVVFCYEGLYSPDTYRYNCYRTTNFSYCFANKDKSVKINFIVKDNKPSLNGHYGTDISEVGSHILDWARVDASLASMGITFTKKPTVLYDGYNQANAIAGYYDMRSGLKSGMSFIFGDEEITTGGWGCGESCLIYNGATNKEEFQMYLTVFRDFPTVYVNSVSLY